MRVARFILAGLIAGALAAPAAAQPQPSCEQVVREANREVNHHQGRPAKPRTIASHLGTDVEWVLRCLEAYGRAPDYSDRMTSALRDEYQRAREEGREVKVDEFDPEPAYERQRQFLV